MIPIPRAVDSQDPELESEHKRGWEGSAIVEVGGDLGVAGGLCGAESQTCHKIHTVTDSSPGI